MSANLVVTATITLLPGETHYREFVFGEDGEPVETGGGIVFADGTTRPAEIRVRYAPGAEEGRVSKGAVEG